MTSKQFILDLPSGTEFSIEEFVREVNKKLKSEYSVRSKEPEQRDLLPMMVQQLNKRINGIEDYLNDWTESQLKTNKIVTDQYAILCHKVTEIDQWSNTVIDETNRIIKQVNAYDPEGSRKYMFSVIDSIVKEINDQRQVLNKVIEDIDYYLAERAVTNIEKLEAKLQKDLKKEQKLAGGKKTIKKSVEKSPELIKKDIEKAERALKQSIEEQELAKSEETKQQQKRGRGRPRKDQTVTPTETPLKPVKKQKIPRSAGKKR